ncbi:hypothetical protein J4E93_010471 [Alternaria ventricosa]|uniref:uncharacterized protein n=1 Tax=Alternaria ventricosa TaxID=1187951 RepID=UPI0020C4F330|nr:uncharacterized protein J4E93_010471 [Alternaria ventricosa]KAI4638003.1 hypothetical protein J4E93_010471 [Alternaria ventricosa]
MASKKFAHWNGFPFMTAPRTKYYSGQTQSPLFRLSREIRDIIYEYYALGEGDNGYHYDSETGKMLEHSPSSEPKRVVRLGLMITCRIAAEELKNCAFHFSDALQHILILAKTRDPPKFAELACSVFGLGRCPLAPWNISDPHNNYFDEGALYSVFSWHPNSWMLPSNEDLAKLEALICLPVDSDFRHPMAEDGTFYFEDISDHVRASGCTLWYFSAASIAIDFCE